MSERVPVWALNHVNGSIVDLQSPLIKKAPKKGPTFSERDNLTVEVRQTDNCVRYPEIAIYEHANWGGAMAQTSLNWNYVGGWWNDKISSIVILGGTWRLYEHRDFAGQSWDYGPGQYPQIPNDVVSSFKLISWC